MAEPGDQTKDASQPWPDDRKVVDLGVLTLTKVVPNSMEVEKKLLFVPTNVTPGIELSDDPLPRVRAAAYGVSFASAVNRRRAQKKRDKLERSRVFSDSQDRVGPSLDC